MAFTAGDPGESSIDADVGNALGGGSASSSNDKDFGSDSGPQSGPNVGSKDFGQNLGSRPQGPAFGGMDMSPGRSRSMFGTTYGTQLAGIDQNRFNQMRGITATNPFGKNNIFSKYLGIDPKNIDYSQNIPLNTRLSIANNQFSNFVNPQNRRGMPGYNPAYATAEEGKLRAGVQSDGYMTAYGPVMGQAREQSVGEMIARGAMGLFGGPVGMLMGQLGTQEYGLPGQPGFDSFDPNNPRAGGGILGAAMLGGLNTSQAADKAAQAVDSLRARFSPTLAPTANAGIGSLTPTAPVNTTGFEEKRSQRTLANGVTMTPMSNGMNEITMPDGRKTTQNADGTINSFSSYDMYAGEQLAGLFGENPKAPGFRALEENIKSIINKENLPDNQNMYGPGTPDLNDILNMYGMETVG